MDGLRDAVMCVCAFQLVLNSLDFSMVLPPLCADFRVWLLFSGLPNWAFIVTLSGWAGCPRNTETLFTFWHRLRDPRRAALRRPGDRQRGARDHSGGCEARRGCCAWVPVDTSPTVVKFPALPML